jgi:hypothetical protein
MARVRPRTLPKFLVPMAAESVKALPKGPGWTYEVKPMVHPTRKLLFVTCSRVTS